MTIRIEEEWGGGQRGEARISISNFKGKKLPLRYLQLIKLHLFGTNLTINFSIFTCLYVFFKLNLKAHFFTSFKLAYDFAIFALPSCMLILYKKEEDIGPGKFNCSNYCYIIIIICILKKKSNSKVKRNFLFTNY